MSERTTEAPRRRVLENSIGWCDDTGNKVIGCEKVSAGCKNCYAEVGTIARVMRSRAVNPVETWGPNGTRIAVLDFTAKLKRLNKLCICDDCHETFSGKPIVNNAVANCHCGGALRRIRLFADSNSDWLDDKWPIETLAEFLDELRLAPNVDVLLLTKRPENFLTRMGDAYAARFKDEGHSQRNAWLEDWRDGKPPTHIWLGVSVEDNNARRRIGILKDIPAAVRFISFEPLLEELPMLENGLRDIDWAIVGGESGGGRRDCGVEPIVNVAQQCVAAGVKCYVKQDCAFKSGQQGRIPDSIWKLKQFPANRSPDSGCRGD